MALLSPAHINSVYQAALDMGATGSRTAILSGLPAAVRAGLANQNAPATQFLNDLRALNERPDKEHLESVLESIILLYSHDPRCKPVIAARDALARMPAQAGQGVQPPPPNPAAAPELQALFQVEDNEDNFERLSEQVRALSIVPFVGAGLSIPCGMPGWRSFIEKAAKDALDEDRIRSLLDTGDFEGAAEALIGSLGKRAFSDKLDASFGQRRSDRANLKGAVTLLPLMARGPVVTTNFDRILERVFTEQNRMFEEKVWGARSDLFVSALHQNKRFLLKIHGDVNNSQDRVLTLSDYAQYYGSAEVGQVDISKPLPRALEQLFSSRTMLFLGCSLQNDRTVRLIQHVASHHAAPPVHYAIVELPQGRTDIAKRKKFLSDHNIRPLFFPSGQFEGIEVFLKNLPQV